MFNYLKRTRLTIGGMHVEQSVQPFGDGDQLHVMTTVNAGGTRFHTCGSTIPYTDMEKLADEQFRTEIARRDLTAFAKELRETVEVLEKALNERLPLVPHCGETIIGTQNICTRDRGHVGDHRCNAGDVDTRISRGRAEP